MVLGVCFFFRGIAPRKLLIPLATANGLWFLGDQLCGVVKSPSGKQRGPKNDITQITNGKWIAISPSLIYIVRNSLSKCWTQKTNQTNTHSNGIETIDVRCPKKNGHMVILRIQPISPQKGCRGALPLPDWRFHYEPNIRAGRCPREKLKKQTVLQQYKQL